MPVENPQSVQLAYQEGKSDKVYHVQLEQAPGKKGWVVNFQFGRRGGTLKPGTKTDVPLAFHSAALAIFNELVNSKMAKGYKNVGSKGPIPAATSYVIPAVETERQTEIFPQLLNECKLEQTQKMIESDEWCAQEKKDGKNIMLCVVTNKARAINRSGKECGCPEKILAFARKLAGDSNLLVCGELVGEVFWAHDVLEVDDQDMRNIPYENRYETLADVLDEEVRNSCFQRISLAVTRDEKAQLMVTLFEMKAEGIVFKRKKALFVPGRPSSGGDMLKYKFTETATLQVMAQKAGKRSIEVAALDNDKGGLVHVGSVTVYPNQEIPPVGSFVEVRYLYAFPGGSIYQPVLLHVRDDKEVADRLDSLKLKAE